MHGVYDARANANPEEAFVLYDEPAAGLDPVTSQNTTVTVFLTSTGGSAVLSALPHSRQYLALSGFSAPQLGHVP